MKISRKKLYLISIIVFSLMVFIIGCSEGSEKTSNGEWSWPGSIRIGSLMSGTSNYLSVSSWTPLLEEATGMKVRMAGESNYPLALRWVKDGIIDTHIMNQSDLVDAVTVAEGSGFHTNDGQMPENARVLWVSNLIYDATVTPGTLDVKTPFDLKGMRFALPADSPGMERMLDAILAFGDLTRDDLEIVYFADFASAMNAFYEGRSDVSLMNTTVPLAFEAEGSPKGINLVEFDPEEYPEGAERMREHEPWKIFGPCIMGPESMIGKIVPISPYYIYTTTDRIDEDLAYNLVKWLVENHDQYKDLFSTNVSMTADSFYDVQEQSIIPVHEGTIKYMKEIGKWTESDDAREEEKKEYVRQYVEAYAEVIDIAEIEGVPTNDPKNKEWQKLWSDHKTKKGLDM